MPIRIRKNSHFIFVCLLSLLIILLMVRYSFNADIPRIILTSIIIVIALIGNRNENLSILLCCIPLHEAIDFYIAILACIVILIIKDHCSLKISKSIVCGFLMLLWELLHCFIFASSFSSIVIAIVPLVVLIVLTNYNVSEIDYPFIVRSLAVISVAICTVTLLNTIVQANFDFEKAVSNLYRLGILNEDVTLVGGQINPNSLGVINVLIVSGLLQLRSLNCNKKIDYILGIILIVFGVLTSSRTFLVCLLIMFTLLLIGQKGSTKQKIYFFVGTTGAVLIALFLMNWLFPSVLEYYIGRFQDEDITTGRDYLMIKYHSYIDSHLEVLMFGIGVTDLSYKAVNIYQITSNAPHNSIQEIVLSWGLPGLLMIAFFILIMYMESKRYGKKKILLNFIPLIIILTKSMAGQLLTSGYTMLSLVLAYLSLCQNFKQTEEN